MRLSIQKFWACSVENLLCQLNSSEHGLSQQAAQQRLIAEGYNTSGPPKKWPAIRLFISQIASPLPLLLIITAAVSWFLGGHTDSLIIVTIVCLSSLLSFFQEQGALSSLEKMLRMVTVKTTVIRDSIEQRIDSTEIVPGDVLILQTGNAIPADLRVLESCNLLVNESHLTGEVEASEKTPGTIAAETPLHDRTNAIFYGSSIVSGYGKAIVVATGQNTELSHIIAQTRFHAPTSAFEQGVKHFGIFLLIVTITLVSLIFIFNLYLNHPAIEALLFSLALAVGLTPQLLPAIISVNLAHGAKKMAHKRVVVKRLASIENFGQMDVLCVDKTGTLTEGILHLEQATDCLGNLSAKTLLYASLNAHFQAGYQNPLDEAICKSNRIDLAAWKKIGEIPYDFHRKRTSISLQHDSQKITISKGAVPQILPLCKWMELENNQVVLSEHINIVESYYKEMMNQGFRVLAVAYGEENEGLTLTGFLLFLDRLKSGIVNTIDQLAKQGVSIKIITGDHALTAMYVGTKLGFTKNQLITAFDLQKLEGAALDFAIASNTIFAEVEPKQKEIIVASLRKQGFIVGFLGDGVNDIAALHTADVSIAVNTGADAAKEIADIVMLNKDLHVLRQGVEEGRRTFANTIKYVYLATSANFGNMFSLAGCSLFLPFLPLLPKQILLTNLLTDIPEMAIASDHVDLEMRQKPIRWNLTSIRSFMIIFGLLSSCFDYATFYVLLVILEATPAMFRTGWFIESVMSATLVVLILRTHRPLFSCRPSILLVIAIFCTAAVAIVLPYLSWVQHYFELKPLPPHFWLPLGSILMIYLIAAEKTKRLFFKSRLRRP